MLICIQAYINCSYNSEGFVHTELGIMCKDHDNTSINLFDENECRSAKALLPHSRFKKTIHSTRKPEGCFIDGLSIYWNTSPTRFTVSSIRSICKAGK